MKTVLFYVSGHGYGHVVRIGETIRALQKRSPETRILARSQAPKAMFPLGVEVFEAETDPGVVEKRLGTVIDEAATIDRLKHFLSRWDAVLETELNFVRREKVDLIVADVPPIAGDIAHAAGLPCVAISNFTWDWIYEPYAPGLLAKMESAYARMPVLLRLPFHQDTRLAGFGRIVDAPLVARKVGDRLRAQNCRLRVLLGSRADISAEALARAAEEAPEFEIIQRNPNSSFEEDFASCDLVIAKLGFSMLAECIANQKPILYPPRQSFREETVLRKHVQQHVSSLPISVEDFYDGNWAAYLRELAAQIPVVSDIRVDGGEFCAEFLCREMLGR